LKPFLPSATGASAEALPGSRLPDGLPPPSKRTEIALGFSLGSVPGLLVFAPAVSGQRRLHCTCPPCVTDSRRNGAKGVTQEKYEIRLPGTKKGEPE